MQSKRIPTAQKNWVRLQILACWVARHAIFHGAVINDDWINGVTVPKPITHKLHVGHATNLGGV